MENRLFDQPSFGIEPWGEDPSKFLTAVAKLLPFEALALGLLDIPKPQPDELLVVHGWSEAQLLAWCQDGCQHDHLLRSALQAGLATNEPGSAENTSPLVHGGHALMLALPEGQANQRWWWLMLGRKDHPFTAAEQQLARIMLRHWQMRFCLPKAHVLTRLLLGHDDRLLLTDITTQARLLYEPRLLDEFLAVFHPVVEQRYPELAEQQTRDISVRVAQQPYWACFRRWRAVHGALAEHWYIELYPLDAADLPPIGLVKDERLARAIAYIHEHYHQAPSLSEVARYVHVSPFHFHRLFTRQIGISPKQYLQKKQLQMAKWFLRQGGVPIGTVAQRIGFSSHGHFTSTFHRVVGVSPSEYRDSE